jgi:hypothetical protein
VRLLGLGCDGHVFGNGPHKADQFTGNGHHELVDVFAASHQFSIAFTQSHLCLPADVLDGFGLRFQSQLQVSMV